MKALVALVIILFAGCSSSTVTTKVTITERPDSLLIKGDSVAFQARSDSVRVDSVAIPTPKETPSSPFQLPSPLRRGVGGAVFGEGSTYAPPRPAFYSVHAKKDTTIGRWKLRFAYAYPPDSWSVKIIEADTTARWKVRDSLIEKPYEMEVIPLWIKLLIGALGAALILSLVKR